MRKLYNEFFHIPKDGKIREKVMLARVAAIIAIMIMCLAAMSITAYAYFSYNVTSVSNTIKAANFEANVSIKITNPDNGTVPLTKDGLTQKATLPAVGTYTVELTPGGSTAKTGFCVITIGDKTYYTQQFGKDQRIEANAKEVKFTLIVSSETEITILSSWGTSSCYGYANRDDNPLYIQNGDDLSAATTDLNDSQINDGKDTGDDKTSVDTTQPVDTTVPDTSTTPPKTTVPIETTTPTTTTTPETTGTSEPTSMSEPTDTTEPSTSATEPATTPPTPSTETTGTQSTEPAGTETTEPTETRPTTENTETTGAPATDASK